MIGKVMKGATFKGCVNYVLGKDQAKLLDADGVLLEDRESIINSFNTQRLMKPNIKHPMGHISLSYSPEDKDRLTDGAMVKLAGEYMQEMGIKDTQYILARHSDNDNPHVHLVYNRIDNNGRTISDKNDRYRNEAICKKIKDKYKLTYGKGKEKVKQHRLRGKDEIKYEIYQSIKKTLPKSTNWDDLDKLLKEKGISLNYKYKGQTNEVQGISFTKENVTFKGSEVDRGYSYSKINKLLEDNNSLKQELAQRQTQQPSVNTHSQTSSESIGGIFSMEQHGVDYEEEQFARKGERDQEEINRKIKRIKPRGI